VVEAKKSSSLDHSDMLSCCESSEQLANTPPKRATLNLPTKKLRQNKKLNYLTCYSALWQKNIVLGLQERWHPAPKAKKNILFAPSGIRTHAEFPPLELESNALDRLGHRCLMFRRLEKMGWRPLPNDTVLRLAAFLGNL
jgi:hypothetical protein